MKAKRHYSRLRAVQMAITLSGPALASVAKYLRRRREGAAFHQALRGCESIGGRSTVYPKSHIWTHHTALQI